MTPTNNQTNTEEYSTIYQAASGYVGKVASETQKPAAETNMIVSISSQATEAKVNVNWEKMKSYEDKKEINRVLRSK